MQRIRRDVLIYCTNPSSSKLNETALTPRICTIIISVYVFRALRFQVLWIFELNLRQVYEYSRITLERGKKGAPRFKM